MICREWELEAGCEELALLEHACNAQDLTEKAAKELEKAGSLTYVDRFDQPRRSGPSCASSASLARPWRRWSNRSASHSSPSSASMLTSQRHATLQAQRQSGERKIVAAAAFGECHEQRQSPRCCSHAP